MHQRDRKSGVTFFQRIGVRLGLADESEPMPEALGDPSAANTSPLYLNMTRPAVALEETPAATKDDTATVDQALSGLLHVMDQPPGGQKRIREIRDLARLSGAVTGGPQLEIVPETKLRRSRKVPIYASLAKKTIGMVGWDAQGLEDVQRALAGQKCQFTNLPLDPLNPVHGVELPDCDVTLLAAPNQWELTEPIDLGILGQTQRPVLVAGHSRLLLRLAQVPQPGPRDYVTLPLATGELAWRAALMLAAPVPPKRIVETRIRREKPEILIADDDPTTRILLSTLLTRQGMTCLVAENGGEALELFKSRKPCAAVIDIVMSCMDGFQVLAAVKQDRDLQDIPVILLTSRNAEVDKLQAFALGADDYLVKPFSPMELAVRLKRLLKQAS